MLKLSQLIRSPYITKYIFYIQKNELIAKILNIVLII